MNKPLIEKLKQVKDVLVKLMSVKLAQATLDDGVTVFEAESFEVGFSVGIVQEEGIVPVPAGHYTMADGSMLVVEQEGIISCFTPATAEPAKPVTPDTTQQAAAPKKVVETVSKESFFEANELLTQAIELQAQEIAELRQLLSETPAAKKTVVNPEVKLSEIPYEKMTNFEKLKFNKLNK